MSPHLSRKSAEILFDSYSKQLLRDIRHLRHDLHIREQAIKAKTIGLISEAQEKGEQYEAHILAYLNQLDKLKTRYTRKINLLGTRVTVAVNSAPAVKPSRKAKNYRRNMWLEFATALEPLAARPSKKIAALLLGPSDELLAWDLNHTCSGITVTPEIMSKDVEGGRGHLVWCAERNVLAQYLGLAALVPSPDTLAQTRDAASKLTRNLVLAVINDPLLKDCTIVSSHYPCGHCANVIAPHHDHGRIAGVGEVITQWNLSTEGSLTTPTRQTKRSAQIFSKAGVPVRRKIVAGHHFH